jgi:hypothetical protein
MGWRYYHTNTRESYWWASSEFQVGATADVRTPPPSVACSADVADWRGGDGSMGDIPLVLFTATTGLTRSWRSGPSAELCFDSKVPTECPLPRWPTNANLSTAGEWVEVDSDHYVPFHKVHADRVAAKTVAMVRSLAK